MRQTRSNPDERHDPGRPPLLSSSDAAASLAISKRKLWELTNRGVIPHVRIGSRIVRYRQEDLDRYIQSCLKGQRS